MEHIYINVEETWLERKLGVKMISIEQLIDMLDSKIDEVDELKEKIEEMQNDIEENYIRKQFNPYDEYGLNKEDFS